MTEDKGVQSIDRALDIIEAVAEAGRPMGLTEIANQVGLHKSTAYRIIETLFKRGYLAKTDEGSYKIGLKLIDAVSCYINSLETVCRQACRQIRFDGASGRFGRRICGLHRENGRLFDGADVFADRAADACLLFVFGKSSPRGTVKGRA